MPHFVRWTFCGKIRRHNLAGGTKPRKDGWIRLFDCFSFCGGAAIAGVQPACTLHKACRKTVQKNIWSTGLSVPSFPEIAQRQTQLRLFLRGENLNRQMQKKRREEQFVGTARQKNRLNREAVAAVLMHVQIILLIAAMTEASSVRFESLLFPVANFAVPMVLVLHNSHEVGWLQ